MGKNFFRIRKKFQQKEYYNTIFGNFYIRFFFLADWKKFISKFFCLGLLEKRIKKMNGSKLSATFFVSPDKSLDVKESQKIIFKGENTLEDVHNTDPNNVFGEHKNKYDRNDTLAKLKVLRKYANVNIRKLEKDIVHKFYSILKTERLLQNEPILREIFLGDVKNTFGDVKSAEPGTPGALFIKCNGSFECDPSCETSIFKEKSNCDKRVLHYSTSQKQFNNLNDIKTSDVCVIYVDAKEASFKGFTSTDIQLLTSHGCESYILMFSGYDNKASLDQYPVTPISELPKMKNENLQPNQPNQPNKPNQPIQNAINKVGNEVGKIGQELTNAVSSGISSTLTNSDSSIGMGNTVVLIIVIMVLVILIILFAYYSTQRPKKEYYSEDF